MNSRTLIVAGLCLTASQCLLADEVPGGEMARCAAIDDATSRLACYDALSGRQVSAAAEPPAVSAPGAVPPDEFGSERINKKEEQDEEESEVLAHVTRCVKDSRKRFHFYLEGGQVWKQVSDKKLWFRECDFDVTISKDFFGYKMQVVGEKSKIRVSRVR